jgi:hypothetical protein
VQQDQAEFSRRSMLFAGATAAVASVLPLEQARAEDVVAPIIEPPVGKRILLSCKLGMIAKKVDGKDLTLTERLKLAGQAGFDGVDFDEAGSFTAQQAREAVQQSGVFVHNAINHAHWGQRLTSAKEEERNTGRANIEHCLRVSHGEGLQPSQESICIINCQNSVPLLLPLYSGGKQCSWGQPALLNRRVSRRAGTKQWHKTVGENATVIDARILIRQIRWLECQPTTLSFCHLIRFKRVVARCAT